MRVDRVRLATLAAGLVTVVVVTVAGCSSEAGGNPTAQPTTGASGDQDPDKAPKVEDPLDASSFLDQPCAVLSQQQLAEFSVTRPGEPTTTGAVAENAGPYCGWHADPGGSISVGFLTGNKNGLSDLYRDRANFEHFEPTTVDGYPAAYNNDPDLRAEGDCDIAVGISDSLAFHALEQGRLDAEGSCERARQVAAAVLETLKGGG
jgi:uncharacterized protein DUF3558